MRQKSNSTDLSSEEIVKGIRRATRKKSSWTAQTAAEYCVNYQAILSKAEQDYRRVEGRNCQQTGSTR
jgi:hypothetical protein